MKKQRSTSIGGKEGYGYVGGKEARRKLGPLRETAAGLDVVGLPTELRGRFLRHPKKQGEEIQEHMQTLEGGKSVLLLVTHHKKLSP